MFGVIYSRKRGSATVCRQEGEVGGLPSMQIAIRNSLAGHAGQYRMETSLRDSAQWRIQPVELTVFQNLKIQKMVWNYRELITCK